VAALDAGIETSDFRNKSASIAKGSLCGLNTNYFDPWFSTLVVGCCCFQPTSYPLECRGAYAPGQPNSTVVLEDGRKYI